MVTPGAFKERIKKDLLTGIWAFLNDCACDYRLGSVRSGYPGDHPIELKSPVKRFRHQSGGTMLPGCGELGNSDGQISQTPCGIRQKASLDAFGPFEDPAHSRLPLGQQKRGRQARRSKGFVPAHLIKCRKPTSPKFGRDRPRQYTTPAQNLPRIRGPCRLAIGRFRQRDQGLGGGTNIGQGIFQQMSTIKI